MEDDVALSENEFLAKPCNIGELIERMNEIVARSGAANADAAVGRDAETSTEESATSQSGNSQSQESEQPDELDGRQRRRHARTPMFGSALMIGSDGKPMDCDIVDISESGCALKLADRDKECPTIFTLYTEDPKRQWQCELRWRRKDRIGAEFQ